MMTYESVVTRQLTDSFVQCRIAEALQLYARVDLTIPAQRAVANEVRSSLGLSPLLPLGEAAIGFIGEITRGAETTSEFIVENSPQIIDELGQE